MIGCNPPDCRSRTCLLERVVGLAASVAQTVGSEACWVTGYTFDAAVYAAAVATCCAEEALAPHLRSRRSLLASACLGTLAGTGT